MTDMAASISIEKKKNLGIYIHIPFCEKKCNYCDFVSYDKMPGIEPSLPFSMHAKRSYVSTLRDELRARKEALGGGYCVDSVYYGGGTPTTVEIEAYKELNEDIRAHFSVCENAEITIEANPETIDVQKAEEIQSAGFNRISLGVQSLDDEILSRLGRIHTAKKAEESYKILRRFTPNINVDLMLGLPGQTLAVWANTLRRILDWSPEHISFYSLQIEEGTSFYKNYRSGAMDIPSWESNREMYHMAVDLLKKEGYGHYEISNAAKAGFECRHNIKYWTLQPYMGLGLSAHSYLNNTRSANPSDMEGYKAFATQGFPFEDLQVRQTEKDDIGDYFFTELRLIKGFSLKDYKQRFGSDFLEEYKNVLPKLFSKGLLEQHEGYIRLSRKGLDHTNPVMEVLLNA